jgi:hypothetical protein
MNNNIINITLLISNSNIYLNNINIIVLIRNMNIYLITDNIIDINLLIGNINM